MSVRVMLSVKVAPEDRDGFERAYLAVTEALRATAGHLRDELLRDAEDGVSYILLAEWSDEALFRAWVEKPEHRQLSAPLVPYLVKGDFDRRVFHVAADLSGVRSST